MKRIGKWLLLALVIILLLSAVSGTIFCINRSHLTVYAIDVGQGDATLICSAGETMLIDAGPGVAEEELCAVLAALGVGRIDVLVLTHSDEDHIGGADLVLRRFAVSRVYVSPYAEKSENYLRLLSLIADERCALLNGTAGTSFSLGRAEVSFLSPPPRGQSKGNHASIVTRVSYGKTAVLLMGDVGEKIELNLLSQRDDLRADLLKIAHHGADDSTAAAFLDAVAPRFAIISCGWNNAYGHPSRRVLDMLADRDIAVGRTDLDGTLVYVSDGKKLWRVRR